MLSSHADDILTVLALTVFADKQVKQAEIDSFVQAANRLQLLRDIEPRMSEARLLAWFHNNKVKIISKMNSTDFELWYKSCLDRIQNVKDKNALLSIMGQISIADAEVHVNETALIIITARHWGIKL